MTAQDLKNSILQLAIQGKLVEQREEEGTAKDLLEQIKTKKEQLIKEKKSKKEQSLPEIAEEEIPFEIPESWEWVRLGDIVQIINGDRGKNYPSKDKLQATGIPFISAVNIENNSISPNNLLCLSQEQYDRLGSGKLMRGDLVLCIRGSLGKNGRYPFDNGAIASSLVILRDYLFDADFYNYISMYLDSGQFSSEVNRYNNGTAQPNLGARDLAKFMIPLPSIYEQKRIISRIEELMPYIEQYDKAYSKLEVFNKKFPQDMQKSILQYAIQGKLVEQRPEEGTAEELYQQIQAEKESLIKEGKIKKEKPLSDITEDEIPFEIPESWKWVRLQEIITILGDGIHGTPNYDDSGDFHFINGNNLDNGKILIKDNTKKINKKEYEKYKKNLNSSTVLVSINGTIGNVAFYKDEKVMLGKSACYFNLIEEQLKYYIYWIIKTNYFMKYAIYNATGTTIKNVSLETMKNLLIPLPPVLEQKRIVQAIEELLPYCQQLIK